MAFLPDEDQDAEGRGEGRVSAWACPNLPARVNGQAGISSWPIPAMLRADAAWVVAGSKLRRAGR
ncbi:MAG: hypothetical protein ACTHPS_23090 [Streptosporangiaceae bacterium]